MPVKDLKTFAIYARAALLTGACDRQTIIEHVDKMIAAASDPDPLLIELSLSTPDTNEVIHTLNDYLKDDPAEPEAAPFIAIIAKRYFAGVFTAEQAAHKLFKLISETSITSENESVIRNLELNFEPFMPMNREEAVAALEDYLSKNKGLTFSDLFNTL